MLNSNFGKLIDGVITYAPTEIRIGNTYYPAPTDEQYLAAGWKRIVDERPAHREGYYNEPKGWEESDVECRHIYAEVQIHHTESDFNAALESHLREERTARGYDEREPSDYKDSGISRWRKDALDWITHRDEVMVYGLTILNEWKATGVEPSYDEFVANLPKIKWTEA